MTRLPCAVLAALLAVSTAHADPAPCGLKQVLSLDAQTNAQGSILVPVTIDDRPTALILDTGAVWSVVRPSMVSGLDVERSPLGMTGAGGEIMDRMVTVPKFELGPVVFKKQDLILGPEGFSSDPRVGGNLAANVLTSFDLEIDPAAGRIMMFTHDHCPGQVIHWAHQDLAAVPLDVRKDGLISIPVGLDGKGLRALIDTGAATSVLHQDVAERVFGLKPGDPGMEQAGEGETIDGKRMALYRHRFGMLTIEGVTFSNPVLTIGEDKGSRLWGVRRAEAAMGAQPFDLILGMHQLRMLHLYFAYGEKMLYATTVAGDAAAAGATGQPSKPAAGAPPPDSLDYQSAGPAAAKAQALMQAGDLDGAIRELGSAIRVTPTVPALYADRGEIEIAKGQYDAAIADQSRAIELDPKLAAAYVLRGQAYVETGKPQPAQADFDKAIALDPKLEPAFEHRGLLRMARHDTDGAIVDLTEAVRLDPKRAPAYFVRCQAYATKHQIEPALSDCDQALTLSPGNAAGLALRAQVRVAAGQLDGAITDFDAVIKGQPDNARALYGRGIAKQRKGDGAGAKADLAAAKQIDPAIEQKFGVTAPSPRP